MTPHPADPESWLDELPKLIWDDPADPPPRFEEACLWTLNSELHDADSMVSELSKHQCIGGTWRIERRSAGVIIQALSEKDARGYLTDLFFDEQFDELVGRSITISRDARLAHDPLCYFNPTPTSVACAVDREGVEGELAKEIIC